MGKRVVGIDFGTTNCCVAYYDGNNVKVIPNMEGARLTPSVVSFKGTEYLVGDVAKRQALTNENTITGVKRYMGTDEKISCNNKSYFPEQIASYIFGYLKYYSEEYIGEKITNAIVTVPAHFNNKQRHAIITAAKIAGLTVDRIINEPTAAALAYAVDTKEKEKFLVFDWGGGTLDISILEKKDEDYLVISNAGDNFLGGDDIDEVIIQMLKRRIKIENRNINFDNDNLIKQRLKDAAEKAKIELSTARTATISLPFLAMFPSGTPYNFEYILVRAELEKHIERLVKRAILKLKLAVDSARVKFADISKIVLVGGSTRIPLLQNMLEDIFGKKKIAKNVNVDESIAVGAALQAEFMREESVFKFQLRDITPLALGIEAHLGRMDVLIKKNTRIPIRVIKKYATVEDDQEAVDIGIYQGESPIAKENQFLGSIFLNDLPLGKQGKVYVFVEFQIDDDGLIHASVMNRETNNFKEIQITSNDYMKEEVLARLINEAKTNKKKFERKRKELDLLNKMFARQMMLKKLIRKKSIPTKERKEFLKEYQLIAKYLKNRDISSLNAIMAASLKKEDFRIAKASSAKN